MMVLRNKAMNEHLTITTLVQKELPDPSIYLTERPLFISGNNQDICINSLEQYLAFGQMSFDL